MPAASEHRFEEHTGEVLMEVSAPTREALFAEAGLGLAELMLGEADPEAGAPQAQAIEVTAPDGCALLVDWLNELIFLSELTKQVFTRFELRHVDDTRLAGTAWGEHPRSLKTAVKAATFHDVKVERSAGGWRAAVVLDV